MISLVLSIALIATIIELTLIKKEKHSWSVAQAIGSFLGMIFGSIFRVLLFPFASCLILIYSLRQWLCLSLDYLFTGGEMIIYKNLASKKTIQNYLEELTKNK